MHALERGEDYVPELTHTLTVSPGEGGDSKRNAANQAYSACMQRVLPDAMKEGQRAEQCARAVMKDNPRIRTDPFWAGVTACMQSGQ